MIMNNVFFKEFLKISDVKTIIFLVVLGVILFALNKLPKKKFSFSAKVMVATVIGLVLGLVIQFTAGFPNNLLWSLLLWLKQLYGTVFLEEDLFLL